jgi:hypothetical protein
MIALNLPAATIHTLDLPEGDGAGQEGAGLPKDDLHLISSRRIGQAFRSDAGIGNVFQHLGDSATFDFSRFEGTEFFFIDGSHTYEYAKSDTLRCIAACTGHATFVWHDLDPGHPGVVRWLAEMVASGYPVVGVSGTNLAMMDYEPQARDAALREEG